MTTSIFINFRLDCLFFSGPNGKGKSLEEGVNENGSKGSNNTKPKKLKNFFGGMMSSVKNVMNQLITSPLDNAIPLMDCVAARGKLQLQYSVLPNSFSYVTYLKLYRIELNFYV